MIKYVVSPKLFEQELLDSSNSTSTHFIHFAEAEKNVKLSQEESKILRYLGSPLNNESCQALIADGIDLAKVVGLSSKMHKYEDFLEFFKELLVAIENQSATCSDMAMTVVF